MGDILVKDAGERQDLRLAAYERQHVHRAGVLELGVFIKLIEYYLSVGFAPVLYDYAHSVPAGFVAHVGDAFDPLLLDETGDGLAEHRFVDSVGDLGDDDAVFVFLDRRPRPDLDAALSGEIGLLYTVRSVYDGGCGEIRALQVFHELIHAAVGVVHAVNDRVDRLAEVVRGYVCRHTDGNADGSVHKQIRKSRRKHRRLLTAVVEVAVHLHDVLVNVAQHFIRYLREPRLGVTVGRGRVAVDRTEVAVALDQRVAEREVLSHSHHRAVNRAVAVRMVSAEHVADRRRGLAEGPVGGQVILVHGPEDSPLARLHAVPDVGPRARSYDGHSVLYERRLDLAVHSDIDYLLVFKSQILAVVMFQLNSHAFLPAGAGKDYLPIVAGRYPSIISISAAVGSSVPSSATFAAPHAAANLIASASGRPIP